METVIALLRNGGCSVKNVLPAGHALMQPRFGAVTKIEAFIAPLQVAAVLYNLRAALSALPGIVAAALDGSVPSDEQWLHAITLSGASPFATAAARSSLDAARAARAQTARVKVCKLFIGNAFVFLALDSLHISYGAAIMWSVLFLELALSYLLMVMLRGVLAERQAAADKARLAAALHCWRPAATAKLLEAPAALPLLHGAALNLGCEIASPPPPPWASPPAASDPFGCSVVAAYVKALSAHKASAEAVTKRAGPELAAELKEQAAMHSRQAALDTILLALNVAAFCGYAVFPITFFGPSEASLGAMVPGWPSNSTVRWWGNFVGDFAWTIEPILILVVPSMIKRAPPAKLKSD